MKKARRRARSPPVYLRPGGDEGFEAGAVAVLQDHVGAACHSYDRFRRFAREPDQSASPQRDVAGRGQPSLRDRQRLQAGERGLRAGAAANVRCRMGEIGELAEQKLGLKVDAHPPERELAVRAGIDEGKLERALGPSIELGIAGAGRNRRPAIAKRAAQSLAMADQLMEACNRAVLLRLDDLKLRAASWAHGLEVLPIKGTPR